MCAYGTAVFVVAGQDGAAPSSGRHQADLSRIGRSDDWQGNSVSTVGVAVAGGRARYHDAVFRTNPADHR
jgi:hypothetical protein